ncbi:MAG: hypothetical protein J0H34_09375 [Rhizobiales bacterium]|nr:hypothetical protein [Hyphomicrobiales bacterium]
MLSAVPLLIVPFILYNAGLIFPTDQADIWSSQLFTMNMMSGGQWTMTLGDALVVLTLVLLFVEIVKSTRTTNTSLADHLLSTFVFIAYLVEFLLVQGAAHHIFFTLMVITLVDVLAGFSVSLRAAGRDVNFN